MKLDRLLTVPEGVLVAARVVAAGLVVELFLALIVLDHVERGAFFHVHALVPAGNELVASDQVVVALVGAVRNPGAHAVRPLQKEGNTPAQNEKRLKNNEHMNGEGVEPIMEPIVQGALCV